MNPIDNANRVLEEIDIKSLAIDSERFGPLGFEKSLPILETLQEIFVDFEKFQYQNKLPDNLQQPFLRYREQFLSFLKRLAGFDLRSDPNFRSEHDGFENQIQGFYQDFFQQFGSWITYLRQESDKKSLSKSEIEKEKKSLVEARKQTDDLLKKLEEQKAKLDQFQAGEGKIASKEMATYFSTEAKAYRKTAKIWLVLAALGYVFLLGYLFKNLKIINQTLDQLTVAVSSGGVSINYTLIIISILTKFIFLAIFWYGVSFLIRNYRINSHLAAVNRHRTSVANTLEGFLATNSSATGEMLQNGTEAMFKHIPVGHITKSEKDSGNPMLEIVNKIIGSKGV